MPGRNGLRDGRAALRAARNSKTNRRVHPRFRSAAFYTRGFGQAGNEWRIDRHAGKPWKGTPLSLSSTGQTIFRTGMCLTSRPRSVPGDDTQTGILSTKRIVPVVGMKATNTDSGTAGRFQFRSPWRKKRSNVSHWRLAEEAAVFAIKLRSAFVADLKSRAGRIQALVQHEAPR